MRYNLIIVDDHKMFLDGLSSIISAKEEYNVVYTAKNGKELMYYLEVNPEKQVDIIISDITMPEMDGITLTKQLKSKRIGVKVLTVSMHNDADMIDDLITHDVDGFVHKNAEKQELLKAIEAILKGDKYFSKEIIDVYTKNKFAKKKTENVKLTNREVDVITLIAQEFTTQEIADKLFLSKHTIESYRKNLIAKLGVRNLAGLTKYAIRMKYID